MCFFPGGRCLKAGQKGDEQGMQYQAGCAGALLPSTNPTGPRHWQRSLRQSAEEESQPRGAAFQSRPHASKLKVSLFSQNDGKGLEIAFTLHLMNNQTNQQTLKLFISPQNVNTQVCRHKKLLHFHQKAIENFAQAYIK